MKSLHFEKIKIKTSVCPDGKGTPKKNAFKIQYNKKNEPIRIIHRKENAENETEFFSLELFEYEHY